MSEDPADLTCTLNEAENRQRRQFVRQSLFPKILHRREMTSGLQLVFEDSQSLRPAVEQFVALERQCCGFLNFDLASKREGLVLTIEGPAGARQILTKFTDGFLSCSST